MFAKRGPEPTPLDGVTAVLSDLDGVVYSGPTAIDHAVDALNEVARTHRVGYITNNASRTARTVADHLVRLGLEVTADDVITSPQAAVRLLADEVDPGSLIHVVGGDGLVDEVDKAGFRITRSSADQPAAVIQGFAPHVAWTDLAEAAFTLHRGVPWVATNTDWTIPVEGGIAPGNGTLVSAVHTAVGRLPLVAGKPEVPIFEEALRRFDVSDALFIGDRLDTDILGANRAGLRSALVLTGIDGAKQALAAPSDSRPGYILDDLRQLLEPYPAPVLDKGDTVARTGGAEVRLDGNRVVIVAEGRTPTATLRAACAVIWASGRAIYGLDVPESLYVR